MKFHRPSVAYNMEEIKRLRHWFAGFNAAGGKAPPGVDEVLRKAQINIEDYIKTFPETP